MVRWYQPVAVAVFVALAVPGGYLLDAPWNGLWVLAVLIANPVTRWLRARGHVLTSSHHRRRHMARLLDGART